jgi:hypothetical protein
MARQLCIHLARLVLALALVAIAQPAGAVSQPSSDVLVPYFEVDLIEPLRTSLFAVANDAPQPVEVTLWVHTNWGVPVLRYDTTIGPDAVFTVNLRDWLILGELPGRKLSAEELAHIQAAFCGEPSPRDGLYYGRKVVEGRMVGYVTARVKGDKRPDVLWGDYFVVCPCSDFAQGETLVNIDRNVEYEPGCENHAIRFLDKGAFDGGTELMIWTAKVNAPHAFPELTELQKSRLTMRVFDEAGHLLQVRNLLVESVQMLDLLSLDLPADFGWLDLSANVEFFVTAHFSAAGGFSSALHSYCLKNRETGPGPAITVEKLTNGVDADQPPGPIVMVGSQVTWEYIVTNTGDEALTDISLEDDQIGPVSCPQTALDPGETMTCVAEGEAVACGYENTAIVTAVGANGAVVQAGDSSHYYGDLRAAIAVEKQVNGEDADVAPGPAFDAGTTLAWTVLVSNVGGGTLTGVVVTDDGGVSLSCPKTVLAVGESMTCTGQSVAVAGSHRNLATATADSECGDQVSAQDAANYVGRSAAAIDLEKLVNGVDADTPPGPSIGLGAAVLWTYVVTNTGAVSLSNVTVTDDRGVAVSCPKTVLAAGESMTCTASGTAVYGLYFNTGTATGKPAAGPLVSDSDPAYYTGYGTPKITLEKLVNGSEADTPPGPSIPYEGAVNWAFVVTNTGNVPLVGLQLSDDKLGVVACPKATLAPAESMTCSKSGIAEYGLHVNLATVTGWAPDATQVQATDPAHYTGTINAGIKIEKLTNGEDADTPPGPVVDFCDGLNLTGEQVPQCDPPMVYWTYIVTNMGEVRLTAVTVTDNRGVAVTCPKTALEPGETMTCTASAPAVLGQYSNLGTATGNPPAGPAVSDDDPSHYLGKPCSNQGCTPGYWKNHTGSWPPTGYSTAQTVQSVFGESSRYPPLGSTKLLQALAFGGGSGVQGAAEILLRAGTAALLNASHPGVGYPRGAGEVIADVNTALASNNRDTMLALAAALDADNNLGCPLH